MRKIEQFLPPRFRTKTIRNFMNSTTNQLFSQKSATTTSFFIGRKPTGLYNPSTDFYASEVRKVREDYQLEPTFVVRNSESNAIEASLFYEDMLNVLRDFGSEVKSHDKLLKSKKYSLSFPIDIDMFVNYRNYYWYPDGIDGIVINANPNDIIGNVYSTNVTSENIGIELTNGMFIKLNDDNTYLVNNVGNSIELILVEDIFKHLKSYSTNPNADILERHPKDYVVMDRNSTDNNKWSTANMWIHKDAITYIYGSQRFKPSNTRRAKRPIICFNRSIQLFNYLNEFNGYIDSVVEVGEQLPMLESIVLDKNDNTIKTINSVGTVIETQTVVEGRYTIKSSHVEIGYDSYDSQYVELQSKTSTNQSPLFDIFDTSGVSLANHIKYPDNTFSGNKIMSFVEDEEYGVYDNELKTSIRYRANSTQSEALYKNYLSDINTNTVEGGEVFYKINERIINERQLVFGINLNELNEPTIVVNGKPLPNIVVRHGIQYVVDISDINTTMQGWFGVQRAIRIEDDDGRPVVRPTHANSSTTRYVVAFDKDNSYIYSDGEVTGNFIVVEDDTPDSVLVPLWREHDNHKTTLVQSHMVTDPNDFIEIKYVPNSKLNVRMNNDDIDSSRIHQNKNTIFIDGLKEDDYIEIRYSSSDHNVSSDIVIQEVHPTWTNNPYNEDISEFTFTQMFPHFVSIIRNQKYLTGTALSSNNYRDTLKDTRLGEVIVKHETPASLLAFAIHNDKFSVLNAIQYAASQYDAYKRSIIVSAEAKMRKINIDFSNARRILDDIITDNNGLKKSSEPFSTTYMLAVYSKYTNITLDEDNVTNMFIDISDYKSAFYLYTDRGLLVNGIDFTIDSDFDSHVSIITPLTFDKNDITEIRYYQDVEPSFCPPTPTKFGLSKAFLPRIMVDDTYGEPVLTLRGHDGSETLAYTSLEDFNEGFYDARDIIMLEFETRIYNGIHPTFRTAGFEIISKAQYRNGYFRDYVDTNIETAEISFFNKWCIDNYVDYRKNDSYVDSDIFSFNYPIQKVSDGKVIGGTWRSIFKFYYDTYRPHTMPWEMLGFDIKPNWWDTEYGTDYSSNNTQLWSDLEEGIIRQGDRENVSDNSYLLKSNLFRREGLSNFIPVDSNGTLRDPVSIGIYDNRPSYSEGSREWSFGSYSPVEMAWRLTSTYKFVEQILYLLESPLSYVGKAWNTTDINYGSANSVFDITPHSINNYVGGLSQWIYNYLVYNSEDTKLLTDTFSSQDFILAHKVGGFVDSDELRIFTESYNPNSTTNTTLIPTEDVSIELYQSKELSRIPYSGVIVERVREFDEIKPFAEGSSYIYGDIVINMETNGYYKYVSKEDSLAWFNSTFYVEGRHVEYEGVLYTCIKAHRATNLEKPTPDDMENNIYWKLKGFEDKEWEFMPSLPKSKNTKFRVIGYDPYKPYFTTIKGDPIGRKKRISTLTRNSKQTKQSVWEPNVPFKRGDVFLLPNNQTVIMDTSGVTGHEPTNGTYHYSEDNLSFTNTLSQEVLISPLEIDGEVQYDVVRYGHVFNSVNDVCNFLIAYSRHLESEGFIFDEIDQRREKKNDWFLMASDFMQWANESHDEGSLIILSPAAEVIKFKSNYGVPSVRRTQNPDRIVLLDHKFNKIDDYEVLRLDNKFVLKTREEPIYYCSIGVSEYEHAIYINNVTIFNDINYDKVYSIRKDRLRISAVKTGNWNGTMQADGFIISNGKILSNFDTAADELRHNSDMEYISTSDVYNKLKFHNIGFQQRDYLRELGIDTASQVSFYRGFIQEKGSMGVVDKFTRLSNLGNKLELDVYEEWAFKNNEYGGVTNSQRIEFLIKRGEFNQLPQPMIFEYMRPATNKVASNLYYNINDYERWVSKPTMLYNGVSLFKTKQFNDIGGSAGFVQWNDSEVKSLDLETINSSINSSKVIPSIGTKIHLANSTLNGGSWDIMQLEESGIVVDEIITHGVEGKCSFVIHTNSAVEQNKLYSYYKEGVTLSFRLIEIEDNYYIGKSVDETTLILSDEIEPNDLHFTVWESLRKSDETDTDNLTLANDTKLYIGGDNDDWSVLKFNNGTWEVDYSKREVVDSNTIDNVVLYSNKSKVAMRELRVFDPLQGLYPTSATKNITWITDYDPANYTSGQGYTSWADDMVGKLWWDTSKVSYINYYAGSDAYRVKYWGQMFPNSYISIKQWVRSLEQPEDETIVYTTKKVYDKHIGVTNTFYYYWVENNNELIDGFEDQMTAQEIATLIRNCHRTNGYIAPISSDMIVVNEVTNIKQEDLILQINYRITDEIAPKHTEWTIVGETVNNTKIPSFLQDKMIDSILGFDVQDNKLPFDSLSDMDSYGTGVGQTWFVDVKEARRIFVERMNAYLKDINWWDIDIFWQRKHDIPTQHRYFGLSDWYTITINNDTIIHHSVNDRALIKTLPARHNDLIMVDERVGRMPPVYDAGWTLYRYDEYNDTYVKVGEEKACMQFTEHFFVDDISLEDSKILREFIATIYDVVYNNKPYDKEVNAVFFGLVRYVLTEQPNNDWVFPTSYISVLQRSEELITKPLYQSDKEPQIRGFIDEAKPYRTKLRKYDKIHSAPMEHVGLMVTDFDKNPFLTFPDRSTIILQENLIDKLIGDGVTTEFNTFNIHNPQNVRVFINGRLITRDNYTIPSIRKIKFITAPNIGPNLIKNIVVISHNSNHLPIMNEFRDIRGYMGVYDKSLSVWKDTVNQKHTTSKYDRVTTYTKAMSLETVKSLYDISQDSDTALANFTNLSYTQSLEQFGEFERVMVKEFYNLLTEIVDNSYNTLVTPLPKDNVMVMIDNIIIHESEYRVKTHPTGSEVKFLRTYSPNNVVMIRPKDKTNELFDSINSIIGVGSPDRRIEHNHTFGISVSEQDISETTHNIITSELNDDIDVFETATNFNESSDRGQPEELSSLVIREAIVSTSMNNFKLVPHGYETIKNANIFESVTFNYLPSMENEYPINLNVHPEQVLVIVNGDEWVLNRHYTLSESVIRFIRTPQDNHKVVVTDRLSAFDQYGDLEIDGLKNLNIGGFDGNIQLPDFMNDSESKREFTVYFNGQTYFFESISHVEVLHSIDLDTSVIDTETTLEHMIFPNDQKRMLAIYAERTSTDPITNKVTKHESVVEFIFADKYENNKINIVNRGVINGEPRIIDNTKYTKVEVHNLNIGRELSAMVIVEPYIGNRRNSYPKYGHIVAGRD